MLNDLDYEIKTIISENMDMLDEIERLSIDLEFYIKKKHLS